MSGAETVGEAWLQLLAARGVDVLLANSGTDFPSIVEGLARSEHLGVKAPRAVMAPHENAAVSLLAAGRTPVLAAGRTPVLEGGARGGRSLNIHLAQEMFDQAGMVRETVRWPPARCASARDPRGRRGARAARLPRAGWPGRVRDGPWARVLDGAAGAQGLTGRVS